MNVTEIKSLLEDWRAIEKWNREISRDRTFRADQRKSAGNRADNAAGYVAELIEDLKRAQ